MFKKKKKNLSSQKKNKIGNSQHKARKCGDSVCSSQQLNANLTFFGFKLLIS